MINQARLNVADTSVPRWMRFCATMVSLLLMAGAASHSANAQQGGCATSPSGLVAAYPMEGSAAAIGGGPDGTVFAAATFGPAKVAQGFRAADGYIRVPNAAVLRPATSLSLEGWIRASGSPGSYRYIVSKSLNGTSQEGSYALYTGASGGLFFYVTVGGTVVLSPGAGTGIYDGNFHHIAGTYDGSVVRLYVDGVQVGTGTPKTGAISYSSTFENGDLFIGDFSSSRPFNFTGDIDELGIYNRAISHAEIQAIANAGSAGKCHPFAATNGRLWTAGRNLIAHETPNNAAEGTATNSKVPEWSYGYRSAAASTALTLFTAQQHINDPSGLEGWIAPGQATLGVNTKSSSIIFNTGSGNYKPLLGDQMYLSPGSGNEFLVVRWTAPEAGDYRVLARWVDLDNHGGNGAIAQLIKNGSETFNCTDGKPCPFAEVFQSTSTKAGRAWLRARTMSFNAGETLDFVVGSLGEHTFDATAFNATVRRVPRVAITSPASGSEHSGAVTFNVAVQHNQPIESITLFFDDHSVGVGDPDTPNSITAVAGPGYHKVRAVVRDNDGVEVESPEIAIYMKEAAARQSATKKPASPEQTHFFRLCRTVQSGPWNSSSTWLNGITPQEFDDALIESGHHVVIDFADAPRDLIVNGTLSASPNVLIGQTGLGVKRNLFLNGTMEGFKDLNISNAGKLIVARSGAALRNSKVNNYGRFVINATDFDGQGSIFKNLGTMKVKPPLASQGPLEVEVSEFEQRGQTGNTAFGTNTVFKAPAGVRIISGPVQMAPRWTPLIGNDGNTLIGNDGNTLIGNDGNTLVGRNSGTLISDNGAALIGDAGSGLVSDNGLGLIGNDGNTLIGADGARLIGNDGATLISENGTLFISEQGGALTGTGEIRGNLINRGGFIIPGHSPGGIAVIGNYTQEATGSLVLEIGGKTFVDSFSYDVFQVAGTANLGGNLVVKTINGYTPAAGDTVPGLLYGSHTGNFDSISSNAQVSLGAKGAQITTNGTNPQGPRALNISTRLQIQSGDNALFAGFIVTGPAGSSKKVLIRGIGPSLAQFGVPGTIPDPLLELHGSGAPVINDNWQQAPNANEIPNGFAPGHPNESVIIATLGPGNYSAILKGAHGETGVGLAEVYDLEPNSAAQLANIATRGLVQTGDNVLIGGFIIAGNEPAKILVRAIGPSLSAFGLQGALQDTTLELHDSNGGAISNDNWAETDGAAIFGTTIPPSHPNEAAVLATLAPGNYTAVVRGADDTTGIAVVEAYNLQ